MLFVARESWRLGLRDWSDSFHESPQSPPLFIVQITRWRRSPNSTKRSRWRKRELSRIPRRRCSVGVGFHGKVKYTNKQRCLVLASRGISYRTRHLMKDLEALMPQYKKDVKVCPFRFCNANSVAGREEGIERHHRNRRDEVLHVLDLFRGISSLPLSPVRRESTSMCTCGSVAFPTAPLFVFCCTTVSHTIPFFT